MALIDVSQAVARLLAGEVVGLPTETVYGLAGRIDREDTLRRIFEVKARPFFDPLIVHVHDTAQARRYASEWPEIFDDLTARFWPGPLTLVTRKTPEVSMLITSGLDTVALRCPRHPLALEILRRLGVPLAGPSANRFGRTSPTRAQDVVEEFGGSVGVVDGGPCEVGLESTVVQAERAGDLWRLHILRPGWITAGDLLDSLTPKYRVEVTRTSSAASPGHLKAHYQPSNPVVIATHPSADLRADVERALGRAVEDVFVLELPGAPELAARTLYSEFRRLSERPGAIVIERRRDNTGGVWDAIWDRIERASTARF